MRSNTDVATWGELDVHRRGRPLVLATALLYAGDNARRGGQLIRARSKRIASTSWAGSSRRCAGDDQQPWVQCAYFSGDAAGAATYYGESVADLPERCTATSIRKCRSMLNNLGRIELEAAQDRRRVPVARRVGCHRSPVSAAGDHDDFVFALNSLASRESGQGKRRRRNPFACRSGRRCDDASRTPHVGARCWSDEADRVCSSGQPRRSHGLMLLDEAKHKIEACIIQTNLGEWRSSTASVASCLSLAGNPNGCRAAACSIVFPVIATPMGDGVRCSPTMRACAHRGPLRSGR